MGEASEQRNGYHGNIHVEDENDKMEEELSHKVKALKSLTIDIGEEVRQQNKELSGMNDDFDKGGGLLDATVNRLKRITRSGGHKHICYLMMFGLFIFFIIWMIVKFR